MSCSTYGLYNNNDLDRAKGEALLRSKGFTESYVCTEGSDELLCTYEQHSKKFKWDDKKIELFQSDGVNTTVTTFCNFDTTHVDDSDTHSPCASGWNHILYNSKKKTYKGWNYAQMESNGEGKVFTPPKLWDGEYDWDTMCKKSEKGVKYANLGKTIEWKNGMCVTPIVVKQGELPISSIQGQNRKFYCPDQTSDVNTDAEWNIYVKDNKYNWDKCPMFFDRMLSPPTIEDDEILSVLTAQGGSSVL
jgi:hypothetical protein